MWEFIKIDIFLSKLWNWVRIMKFCFFSSCLKMANVVVDNIHYSSLSNTIKFTWCCCSGLNIWHYKPIYIDFEPRQPHFSVQVRHTLMTPGVWVHPAAINARYLTSYISFDKKCLNCIGFHEYEFSYQYIIKAYISSFKAAFN